MDLHNNLIGRLIGQEIKDKYVIDRGNSIEDVIAQRVLEELEKGTLKVNLPYGSK